MSSSANFRMGSCASCWNRCCGRRVRRRESGCLRVRRRWRRRLCLGSRLGRRRWTAAVMVAVFFTFALSGPLPPKEMGVILGIAVLLDAALVRLLLLPVLLRLMGRWAWYLPRWAHRVLPDVTFGHV